MDSASDFESEGCGFESRPGCVALRAANNHNPLVRMSEWLRRMIRNHLGFARAGSSPVPDEQTFCFLVSCFLLLVAGWLLLFLPRLVFVFLFLFCFCSLANRNRNGTRATRKRKGANPALNRTGGSARLKILCFPIRSQGFMGWFCLVGR